MAVVRVGVELVRGAGGYHQAIVQRRVDQVTYLVPDRASGRELLRLEIDHPLRPASGGGGHRAAEPNACGAVAVVARRGLEAVGQVGRPGADLIDRRVRRLVDGGRPDDQTGGVCPAERDVPRRRRAAEQEVARGREREVRVIHEAERALTDVVRIAAIEVDVHAHGDVRARGGLKLERVAARVARDGRAEQRTVLGEQEQGVLQRRRRVPALAVEIRFDPRVTSRGTQDVRVAVVGVHRFDPDGALQRASCRVCARQRPAAQVEGQ